MTGDLRLLAMEASPAKLLDLFCHVTPDKATLEIPEHRFGTWVCQGVAGGQQLGNEDGGDDWPWRSRGQGDIAEKLCIVKER